MHYQRIVLILAMTFLLVMASTAGPTVQAAGPAEEAEQDALGAVQIIAAATNFLKNVPQFTFQAEIVEDQVYDKGEKIQLVHDMVYWAKRQDKLRFSLDGDQRSIEWFYDGKNVSIYDDVKNTYSITPFPATIDETLDKCESEYGMVISVINLAHSKLNDFIVNGVTEMKLIGQSRVQGDLCYHLLLRRETVDVQMWIQIGEQPLFRKFVITYKDQPQDPQWSVVFNKWNLAPELTDKMFEFTPPADADKIQLLKSESAAGR